MDWTNDCKSLYNKWVEADLNRRHTDFQSVALPAELPTQKCRQALVMQKTQEI